MEKASASSPGEPDEVLAVVLDAMRSALERPDLTPDDDFIAAGGDSYRMVLLIQTVEESLDITVDPELAFDAPSARELSSRIIGSAAGTGD